MEHTGNIELDIDGFKNGHFLEETSTNEYKKMYYEFNELHIISGLSGQLQSFWLSLPTSDITKAINLYNLLNIH